MNNRFSFATFLSKLGRYVVSFTMLTLLLAIPVLVPFGVSYVIVRVLCLLTGSVFDVSVVIAMYLFLLIIIGSISSDELEE